MLQIEVSLRNAGEANVTIIDGSALLWTIHWPADGSVADFGVDVKTRITKYLTNSNVYNHQTPVRGIYKSDVIHQATCFISVCYGKKNTTDMSNTRLFVWGGGDGKGHSYLLDLSAFPPTRFIENVKRAHFQAMMWRDVNVDPRTFKINLENFGLKKHEKTSLSPTLLPDHSKPAPDYILER